MAKMVKTFFFMESAPNLGETNAVILHGIQRSGTNYLHQYLLKSGIKVFNFLKRPGPPRNHPKNKHFRWYADKDAIPPVIRKQYANTITANSLDEINTICKYPSNLHHFVTIKKKEQWIVSILNWGFRCNWFSSVDNAIENVPVFSIDYDNYYNFWRSLKASNPSRISLVSIESIMSDVKAFNVFLSEICNLESIPTFNGVFRELPDSPINRKNYFNDENLKRIQLALSQKSL
jgi:hypothetical protein